MNYVKWGLYVVGGVALVGLGVWGYRRLDELIAQLPKLPDLPGREPADVKAARLAREAAEREAGKKQAQQLPDYERLYREMGYPAAMLAFFGDEENALRKEDQWAGQPVAQLKLWAGSTETDVRVRVLLGMYLKGSRLQRGKQVNDDEQELQGKERERRGQEQARQDAAVAAAKQRDEAQLARQGGKPVPEVIKRPDGSLGYYQAGVFKVVTTDQMLIGPNGRWGRFDSDGRFIPAAPPEG